MADDFFNNGDKAYSENLNDAILVGNSFSWTLSIDLPSDTGGVFPNSSSVVKAKVCDVSATPNSNLSIGSTISNSSGSEQVYRLTVYPNFNRFGGFTSITVDGDADLFIANRGASSPIVDNLDYSDLGNVPELKVLKEYDIVLTLSDGGVVSGLSFGLQSKSGGVSASISQGNVAGLESSLSEEASARQTADTNLLSSLNSEINIRSANDDLLEEMLRSLAEQNNLTFEQIKSVTGTLTYNSSNNWLSGTFTILLNYSTGVTPSMEASNQYSTYDLSVRGSGLSFTCDFGMDSRGCPYNLVCSIDDEERSTTLTRESKTYNF